MMQCILIEVARSEIGLPSSASTRTLLQSRMLQCLSVSLAHFNLHGPELSVSQSTAKLFRCTIGLPGEFRAPSASAAPAASACRMDGGPQVVNVVLATATMSHDLLVLYGYGGLDGSLYPSLLLHINGSRPGMAGAMASLA